MSVRHSGSIRRAARLQQATLYREFGAALYAATSLVYVDLVGRFMVAELVASAGLLTFSVLSVIRRDPLLRDILRGYGLFLLALVFSDLVNGSAPEAYLRGWASIVFSVVSTVFLVQSFAASNRAVYAYLGTAAVSALILVDGSLGIAEIEENSNYFKVRYVPILQPAVALLACMLWRANPLAAAAITLVSGFGFVLFDARSSGAGLVLASLLMFAKTLNFRPGARSTLIVGLVLAALSYGGYVYYVDLVLNRGFGGANAQQVRLAENPYNPLELISYGRAETIVAFRAISERPLVGFGSWAVDPNDTYATLQGELTGKPNYTHHRLGIIPAHSILLGAWLWAGLLGLIGMAMVGWAMLRQVRANMWGRTSLTPAICIYTVSTAWAFLFSPLGNVRTMLPFVIALLAAGGSRAERGKRRIEEGGSRRQPSELPRATRMRRGPSRQLRGKSERQP